MKPMPPSQPPVAQWGEQRALFCLPVKMETYVCGTSQTEGVWRSTGSKDTTSECRLVVLQGQSLIDEGNDWLKPCSIFTNGLKSVLK